MAALNDRAYFDETCKKVMDTRAWVTAELKELGFTVCPSQTNFLFVRHPEKPGKEIFSYLRKEGVLVRRWDIPEIVDWLRISIGTDAEMQELLRILRQQG